MLTHVYLGNDLYTPYISIILYLDDLHVSSEAQPRLTRLIHFKPHTDHLVSFGYMGSSNIPRCSERGLKWKLEGILSEGDGVEGIGP